MKERMYNVHFLQNCFFFWNTLESGILLKEHTIRYNHFWPIIFFFKNSRTLTFSWFMFTWSRFHPHLALSVESTLHLSSCMYIEYLLFINNLNFLKGNLYYIYPYELDVKEKTERYRTTFFFEILISFDIDDHLNTSLYDERDYFNFWNWFKL